MYVLEIPNGRELVWILPPKTGTRSTEKVLQHLKAESVGGRHGVNPDKIPSGSIVVANIRNPYDVIVSWWYYAGRAADKKDMSLVRYVQHAVANNSYLKYSTLPGAEHATEFVRYENGLGWEVRRVLEKYGVRPDCGFPHVGRAPNRGNWVEEMDEPTQELVNKHFYDDFEKFGYEMSRGHDPSKE